MIKITKLGFLLLVVGAFVLALGSSVMAFHDAASLRCMSCHTMHASENGSASGVTGGNGFSAAPPGGVTPGGNPMLLLQVNETDLCLQCHGEGVNASGFGPKVMSAAGVLPTALPGGDYWTSNQTHTGDVHVGGEGHNPYYTSAASISGIIAQDGVLGLTPPGAAGPIGKWDCVACHAPHQGDVSLLYGTANPNFRLLWSKPAGLGSGVTFDAVEGTLSDASHVGTPETDTNHSGYRAGVSAWCGVCHTNFHALADSGLIHPSDETLPGTFVALYNGNPAAGASYSFITPVQDPAATSDTDFDATASSKATCLSCHRAHAASTTATHPDYAADPALINNTRNMTRWDCESASGAGLGCNKCHDKGD